MGLQTPSSISAIREHGACSGYQTGREAAKPSATQTPVSLCMTSSPPHRLRHANQPTRQSLTLPPQIPLPGRQNALLILQLTLVEAFASLSNGLLTVCIPSMAKDLHLPQHLIYWPSTASGLVSCSLLLVAGSVADDVGSRPFKQSGHLLHGLLQPWLWYCEDWVKNSLLFVPLVGFGLALYLPCFSRDSDKGNYERKDS